MSHHCHFVHCTHTYWCMYNQFVQHRILTGHRVIAVVLHQIPFELILGSLVERVSFHPLARCFVTEVNPLRAFLAVSHYIFLSNTTTSSTVCTHTDHNTHLFVRHHGLMIHIETCVATIRLCAHHNIHGYVSMCLFSCSLIVWMRPMIFGQGT